MMTVQNIISSLQAPGESPYFIRAPSANNVTLGQTAVFECQIGGSPAPNVTWYHDTVEITITERTK